MGEIAEAAPKKTIMELIDTLPEKRAIFCLKALVVTGHVTEQTMTATISLAETLRYE